MNILSAGFLILVFSSLLIYYRLSQKFQTLLLISMSIFFYIYSLRFDNLIFFSHVLLVYVLLRLGQRFTNKITISIFKFIIIFITVLPLLIYKYGNIVGLNNLDFAPLGISFITFMMLGYILDFMRNPIKSRINASKYIFLNFFFPHITSGPIARKEMFEPQISKKKIFAIDCFERAFYLITLGVFQKFVIANRISMFSDPVFETPASYLGYPLLIAVYLFSFQLYFDFLAYSNIAVGIARLFGYKLIINFNKPYLATSISDFWRRWHISLSNWLRDYVYIGLGGNRKGTIRKYVNILVTFFVSGLWHGSTSLFILWGVMHGLLIIGEGLTSKFFTKLRLSFKMPKPIGVFLTFNLITFLWIFFKAGSFSKYTYLVANLFKIENYAGSTYAIISNRDILTNIEISIVLIFLFMTIEIVDEFKIIPWIKLFNNSLSKIVIYTAILISLLFFGVFGLQNFYYVRF